jgi:ParB-like chromosome segregation protein Spo0J
MEWAVCRTCAADPATLGFADPLVRTADQDVNLPAHPATSLFPMLGEDAMTALVQDIEANGLVEPAWIYDETERGTVLLDGRNRERACEAAGVELRTRKYEGDDPVGFVVSANLKRRQLTPGQLAFLALEVEKPFDEEAAKRRAQASGQPRGTKSLVAELPQQKSRDRAARVVGCSGRVVSQARRIAKEAPDLEEHVRAGTMAIDKAHRKVVEREKRARVERLALVPTPPTPTTRFRSIVIDPPWQYENTASHGAASNHYPTMTFEELKSLEVPATDEAHLYLWVTNTFVRIGPRPLGRVGLRVQDDADLGEAGDGARQLFPQQHRACPLRCKGRVADDEQHTQNVLRCTSDQALCQA